MRAPLAVTAGLLLAAVLAACGGSDDGGTSSAPAGSASTTSAQASTAASVASLDGTSWALSQVGAAAAEPGGLLAFQGGNLSGSTGCNTFGGTYQQAGASLTIALGAVTQKACAPPLDGQETAVLAALPKTASFTDTNGTLTLIDASGATLLTYGHQEGGGLVGPAWEVTGINNGKQAVASPVPGSTVTATFAADGTVSGSAGCNAYTASCTLSGTDLKVTAPAATRKFCDQPAGVMEQEAAFLAALEHSATVEPDAHGIILRGANGEIQLSLARPG